MLATCISRMSTWKSAKRLHVSSLFPTEFRDDHIHHSGCEDIQADCEGNRLCGGISENKLAPLAGLPTCITMAVESGDPSKGPSIIVFKGKPGCSIPWHWHTPTEHVMIVSGSAKVEMKGGGSAILDEGSVEVTSELGKGATFTVRLPIIPVSRQED
jgi:hypothetical protein